MGIIQQERLTAQDDSAPPIGHNKPPIDIVAKAEFDEALDANQGIRERMEKLLASASRARCDNEIELGYCAETIKKIRLVISIIDNAHTNAKSDYLIGGRVVDQAKNEIIAPFNKAKANIEALQKQYLTEQKRKADAQKAEYEAEQRRLAEEQRQKEQEGLKQSPEQQQAFIEPVKVEAPPPSPAFNERPITRGPEGASASVKMVWKAEIMDAEAAFKSLCDDQGVIDAMNKAAQRRVTAGIRTIEGVRIFQDIAVNNR